MGEELIRENDIEIRLKEYIVQLLNGDEVSDRGGGRRLEGKREIRKTVRGEIMGALNKIKRC